MKEGIGKFVSILILIFVAIEFSGCGVKNEGYVKWGDCREQIALVDGSWEKYYKDFTCETDNVFDKPTRICASVETD